MLEVSSASRHFKTNYFASEAPETRRSGDGTRLHRSSDGADAAAHSLANECEAGTRGTPTAVRIRGLMNLSKGK